MLTDLEHYCFCCYSIPYYLTISAIQLPDDDCDGVEMQVLLPEAGYMTLYTYLVNVNKKLKATYCGQKLYNYQSGLHNPSTSYGAPVFGGDYGHSNMHLIHKLSFGVTKDHEEFVRCEDTDVADVTMKSSRQVLLHLQASVS